MSKITSLLIAQLSILIGGVVAVPAYASPIIVDNPNPSRCELYENRELQSTCDAFRLIRARDESIGLDGFRVEFLSSDSSAIYVAIINDNLVTEEVNGSTVTFYPTPVLTLEQEGLDSETSAISGTCGIASDYSMVVCSSTGFTYLYSGEPVLSQQHPGAPEDSNLSGQTSAGNRDIYVFNTNSHINTGISVNAGDRIIIQASGTIRFGFFAGSGGPTGIFLSPDYNYFVDLLHGQLMGRVKQFGMQDFDGWFPVGEGTEIVAQSAGVLEFAVNDNSPGDNTGSFRIEVTVDSVQN